MAESGPGQEDEAPWLTITEASARSGRHVDALRAMVRRGRIEARRGNRGQWLVRPPEAMPETEHDEAEALAELRDEVAELRVTLARAEAEAASAKAVAQAQVASTKAAAAAEIAAKDALVAELRAMLEDARRPWWRRMIGL